MSLVAYESSGESSDDEENDAVTNLPVVPAVASRTTTTAASDISSQPAILSSSAGDNDKDDSIEMTLKLPAPKTASAGTLTTQTLSSDREDTIVSHLFADLPVTSNGSSGSSIFSNERKLSEDAEDELEDIVKPGRAELALRAQIKTSTTAAATGSKRSRVQILVPALLPVDGDSDDEDAGPSTKAKKPLKPSMHKSSLLASLPPPAHTTTLTSMVPQSLSSKSRPPALAATKPPAAKAATATKPATCDAPRTVLRSAVAGPMAANEDSEDDEDGTETAGGHGGSSSNSAGINFFSLNDDDSHKTSVIVPSSAPHVSLPMPRFPGEGLSVDDDDDDDWTGSRTSQQNSTDVPLRFQKAVAAASVWKPAAQQLAAGWSDAGPSDIDLPTWNAGVEGVSVADGASSVAEWDPDKLSVCDLDNQPMVNEAQSSGVFPGNVNDPQFQRMFGKKSGRKAPPEVKVINVRLDEVLGGVDLTKNLSQEVDVNMMSHSKKHNKDLPSGQQKRKHQITYLAYKAKERELELKNQWAENKFNKRQTQSKYGF